MRRVSDFMRSSLGERLEMERYGQSAIPAPTPIRPQLLSCRDRGVACVSFILYAFRRRLSPTLILPARPTRIAAVQPRPARARPSSRAVRVDAGRSDWQAGALTG